MLYRFWHVFFFIHTILIYSCIHAVFILLSRSYYFYCVLISFRIIFNSYSCRIRTSCGRIISNITKYNFFPSRKYMLYFPIVKKQNTINHFPFLFHMLHQFVKKRVSSDCGDRVWEKTLTIPHMKTYSLL